jgi:phosphotriesterase-related protein
MTGKLLPEMRFALHGEADIIPAELLFQFQVDALDAIWRLIRWLTLQYFFTISYLVKDAPFMQTRRIFLRQGISAGLAAILPSPSWVAGQVMTVKGLVPATALGSTLVHEHVLVDFIGADKVSPDRYDRQEAFQVILPQLRELYKRGCRTMVECTPQFLGRDPLLLKQLSDASGLHLITNTGYYGAAEEKFLPSSLAAETAPSLSAQWIAEHQRGIGDSLVQPGFMKLGVDDVPFTENIQKILLAGAMAYTSTGMPIAVHTSKGAMPAREELRILTEAGVPADAWIWVHAQNEKNPDAWEEIARRGGWVELDGYQEAQTDDYVRHLLRLRKAKCLHRVLVSQDAGWYHVGETGGGSFRPFTAIYDQLLPALKKAGFTETDTRMLMEKNPAEAFSLRIS